jgi:DNA (cytosine-5)-methyltransferase 1
LYELALFTGSGGGLLASKLLGHTIVGYVEIDIYCQHVVQSRIKDGLMDEAPIFGDIRRFIDQGYAGSYQGLVDVVAGGFPCTDISRANPKATGIDGPQSKLWGEMAEIIHIVRPHFAWVENSSMLVGRGLARIIRDLAEMGYDARWCCLGGHDTGSICDGERLWLLAYKADGPVLGSMDVLKYQIPCTEESCRWQYTRAIGQMLSQDDYSGIKRNLTQVARGMERLRAIGNGQDPFVAATAWRILTDDLNQKCRRAGKIKVETP